MSGRYAGWRKLKGDTDRPDLLDVGKRLLGFLDNQRKLSGVPTMGQQVTLPDGSVVWARWLGDQPEILIREGGAKPAPPILEGLVVRPSEVGGQQMNVSKNHVIIDRRLRPYFFDAAQIPPGFSGDSFANTFPDGVRHYGMVDWRNRDETVAVTFYGPENRYFYTSGGYFPFDGYVFFKGSLLLDLYDDISTPTTYTEIRGACIVAGPALLAVARRYVGSDINERLIKYPLQIPVAVKAEDWKRAPKLEIVPNIDGAVEGQILSEWTLTDTSFASEHPWHFNQAGTEARCILANQSDLMFREHVLTVGDQAVGPSIAVARTVTVPRTATASGSSYSGIYRPLSFLTAGTGYMSYTANPDGSYTYTGWDYGGVGPPSQQPTMMYGYPGPASASLTSGTITESETPSVQWIDIAVDYRNNVPVYAQGRAPSYSYAATAQNSVSGEYEAVTSFNGATFGFFVSGGTGYWKTAMDGSCTTTWTYAHSVSENADSTRVIGGLKTDWIELVSATVVKDVYSESGFAAGSATIDAYQDDMTGTTATGSGGAAPPGTEIFFEPTTQVLNSAAYSCSSSSVRTTTTTKYKLAYLDLRSRDITYMTEVEKEVASSIGSGNHGGDAAMNAGDAASGGVPAMVVNSATTRETNGTLNVMFGGATALTEAFVLVPASQVSSSTTNIFTQLGDSGIFTLTTPWVDSAGDIQALPTGATRAGLGSIFPSHLGTLQDGSIKTAPAPETSAVSSSGTSPVYENDFLPPMYRAGLVDTYATADHLGTGARNMGGWATYAGGYCFSMYVVVQTGFSPATYELEYRTGIGAVGRAPNSLHAVTGWTVGGNVVRFNPITFIPPTSR